MDIKETIKYHVLDINELFTAYIELHDYILKSSSTFLSLFKKVDFDDIYNRTKKLLSQFNQKKGELINLQNNFNNTVPKEYIQYFNQLYTFFERLYETVSLLNEKQYKLLLKSKGNKYSYKYFIERENKYKKAIELYMIEAEKLENIDYIIFN
jgi:hypothetical protein